GEVLLKAGLSLKLGADGKQIDAMAYQTILTRYGLSGDAQADDLIGLAGEPVKKRFQHCHQQHNLGRSLLACDSLKRLLKGLIQGSLDGRGSRRTNRWTGTVGRKIQRYRQLNELLTPVLDCVTSLGSLGSRGQRVVFKRQGRVERGCNALFQSG